MIWRGWMALVVGWGLGAAVYGLLVAFRMDLAGTATDSLLLMLYVGAAFVVLGSGLYWLRTAVRVLLGRIRPGRGAEPSAARSVPAAVVASLGAWTAVMAVLLVLGDVLITLAFQPEVSRAWLAVRDLLFLAAGAVVCWALVGPLSGRTDGFLRRIRDPGGTKSLLGICALLVIVALVAPLLGAPTPRWKKSRAGPPQGLQVEKTGLRVLLFGMDGATWKVFGQLMAGGQLPVMGRLVERGVRATLISPPPQVSPAVWTTIVTGRKPDEHGVKEYLLASLPGLVRFPFEALADDLLVVPFFFVGLGYFVAGLAEGTPPTSGQVRTKALWHMASDAGEASLILGWPCTWPAEPVRGLTVTDRFGPSEWDIFSHAQGQLSQRVHPPQAEQRLRSFQVSSGGNPVPMLRTLASLPEAEIERLKEFEYNPLLPKPIALLTDVYDADMSYLNLLQAELARGSYRLVLVAINGMDMVMHAFWKERFPEDFFLRESEHPAWGRLIDAYHQLVDRRVGQILEVAGEGTVVILVSDHGMQADPRNLIWPGWHAPEALFVMSGGPVRRGVEASTMSYLDIAPTVLYLLGYPVPRDLPGRVRTDLIEPDFLSRHPLRRIPTYE